MISDEKIAKLANNFRSAIVTAKENGCFTINNHYPFNKFPQACCGNTSYLLAEYLKTKGIPSIWVSAVRNDWSHAWLVIKDERVRLPQKQTCVPPADIQQVLKAYGSENPICEKTGYDWNDIKNGLIVDITADQFEDFDEEVYVGYLNSFYNGFDFRNAHDCNGIQDDDRLSRIYEIINEYL